MELCINWNSGSVRTSYNSYSKVKDLYTQNYTSLDFTTSNANQNFQTEQTNTRHWQRYQSYIYILSVNMTWF